MTTSIVPNTGYTAIQQDGVDAVLFNGGGLADNVYSVAASVATNALTVTLNPCVIKFRSTTLSDGTTTSVAVNSAVTLTVPDTATLGSTNAVATRLVLVALNNAGTCELAVVNMSGGFNLDESGVLSTTAMSAAADSATVVYSTTARTSVAYKVVGFIDITEATAGTWATAPTLVQGAGGQAVTAMSSLGYGQTWQDLTASRALTTTYYNTTGKPISLSIAINVTSTNTIFTILVNGISAGKEQANNTYEGVVGISGIIVPAGSSYSATPTTGTGALLYWSELR